MKNCATCAIHKKENSKDKCKIHGIINTSVFKITQLGCKCPSYRKLIHIKAEDNHV